VSEPVSLFVIGALLAFLQLLIGALLGLVLYEIRRLRDHVRALEGAFNLLQGILIAKGVLSPAEQSVLKAQVATVK